MSTVKDVAKLAGVSTSTVSRAISGKVFVEEETKKKVLAAAKALDYRPSILAKGLREGKTFTIAFMVPDINSLFFPMIMKSVENYAETKGYSILLCDSNEDPEKELRTIRELGDRNIDGIICMSTMDDTKSIRKIRKESAVPVTFINRRADKVVTSVSVDSVYGGYAATKYLLDHGHRKIGGIFGSLSQKRFRDRFDGCREALDEYGVEMRNEYFASGIDSIEGAYAFTEKLMQKQDRPTAMFASMDILAIGLYAGVRAAGLEIPKDVSVAGFDNIYMTEFMIPPLTTYSSPIEQMAKDAVDQLIAQMDGEQKPKSVLLRGSLIERESVRTINEKP